MANTVMNVALSDTYKTNLTAGGSGNGVYAWAFAFDGTPATKLAQVALVTDGVAAVNPQLNLTQGDGTFLSEALAIRPALHAIGVSALSVRRASGAVTRPDEALVLGAGDTLVLSGLPEPLALAESKLLGRD